MPLTVGSRALLVTAVAVAVTAVALRTVEYAIRKRAMQRARSSRIIRAPLLAFQQLGISGSRQWVALCGTVFDVTGDAFFHAATAGLYAEWTGHDVTALLVHAGVLVCGGHSADSVESLVDTELPADDVVCQGNELAERRRAVLAEWYVRFHTRYAVAGQLTDLYAGAVWEGLRKSLMPAASVGAGGAAPKRGKCPMGFGASNVEQEEIEIDETDLVAVREIRFQGRRYDVSGAALFESPNGALAHMVGHDVTYALAVQSSHMEDLDFEPEREYTYQEQVRLEQFRRVFAKELKVIAQKSNPPEAVTNTTHTVPAANLHALVDEGADASVIQHALSSPSVDVNEICARTSMTPLHKAVEKNRVDVVRMLLIAGADMDVEAMLYDNETALQMARRFGYRNIETALLTPLSP